MGLILTSTGSIYLLYMRFLRDWHDPRKTHFRSGRRLSARPLGWPVDGTAIKQPCPRVSKGQALPLPCPNARFGTATFADQLGGLSVVNDGQCTV